MFLINLWFLTILGSCPLLLWRMLIKRKYMTWRDFIWFVYGIFVASFPGYVMWSQYINK